VRSLSFLVAVPEVPDLVPILICLVGYLSVVPRVREVPKFSDFLAIGSKSPSS